MHHPGSTHAKDPATSLPGTQSLEVDASSENGPPPVNKASQYTDGRALGDWKSRYEKDARRCINREAFFLFFVLVFFLVLGGTVLGMADQSVQIPLKVLAFEIDSSPPILSVSFRILSIFCVGVIGGTMFSIKWLVHAAAKGKWHLDRRYWRMFVPVMGGVYACVVLTLFEGGLAGGEATQPRSLEMTAALAFLVGYFSDGVSGLLSNIANAVFGTLEKK